MIAETSTAPTVVAVAKRADCLGPVGFSSILAMSSHFFVTVVDSVRGDLVRAADDPEQPAICRIALLRSSTIWRRSSTRSLPLRGRRRAVRQSFRRFTERGMTAKNQLRQATFEAFAPGVRRLGRAGSRGSWPTPSGRRLSAGSLDRAASVADGLSFERATAVWRRTLTALLAYRFDAAAAE